MTQLRPYQERGRDEWLERERIGLAFQPGLGKTRTVLSALAAEPAMSRVLVVAPKRVAANVWRQEAALTGLVDPEDMRLLEAQEFELGRTPAGLDFKDFRATAKRLRQEIRAGYHRVHLVGWANLFWLAAVAGTRPLFDTVVLDESGFAGNKTTGMWQAARRLAAGARWRVALNGTPFAGKHEGLFAQSYLIDEGKTFGRTLGDFRRDFMAPLATDHATGRVTEWGAPSPAQEAQIKERFGRLWLPMRAADWLEMPRLLVNDVVVDLPTPAWNTAGKLLRSALAVLPNGATVLPPNAGVGVGKALQACNGFIYDDDKGVVKVHGEKLDALEELVDGTEGGVLLFWHYNHERDAIRQRLGARLACIDDRDAVARWERGEVKVLGAHPRAAAVGLNLQKGGNTQIWFGPTYDSWLWEQGVDRTYRQGQQAAHVVVHRIVTGHPAERAAIAACDRKMDFLKALMEVGGGS